MNKNNIPGIYNYCDRWCEKCPFTSRCLNFEMGEKIKRNINNKDELNKIFWEFFDGNPGRIIESIEKEILKSEEYEDDEIGYSGDDFEIKHLIAQSNDSAQLALKYLEIVSEWMNRNKDKLEGSYSNIERNEKVKLSDTFEVILWYQYQIYVKIMRALHGKNEDMLEDEFPKDSDGSAKVALIGIDRSINAWGKIFMMINEKEENVFNIIQLLVNIQHIVEEEFPNARNFIRPGFDE